MRPVVLTGSFEYAARADAVAAADCYRDLSTLRNFLDSPSSALLFDIPWAPAFLLLLFLVHPLLGMIGLASALLLLLFAIMAEFAAREPHERANLAFVRSYSRFSTTLRYLGMVRAMSMQDGAVRMIMCDAEAGRMAQDTAVRRGEIMLAMSKSVRTLTQILVMGAATWLVLVDNSSPGIIFVASLLLGRGLAPVEGAIGAWRGFSLARDAFQRLNRILEAVSPSSPSMAITLPVSKGHLVLEGVGFTFPASQAAVLNNIRLRLSAGDCLALIGPSGAGKSTLGRIIAGVSRPTSGRALLGGVDISALRRCAGVRRIGYLPQDIELFGGAVKDVIGRLDDADPLKVIEAARLAGLHETIMRLPQGYETDIGEGGSVLLRAQRQQLGLARAAYGDPAMVVLDDPNSSLDYEGERILFEAIERLKAKQITTVIITHRMGILPVTNKIAILRNGTIAAFGDSEKIFENYLAPPKRSAVRTG
jgi:ATP-binding cassette subfamily C protein